MSLENGLILAYDSRTLPTSRSKKSGLSAAQPKYTLSAHDGAASAFDVNPHIRGCLVTGGMDKMVKIWNIQDEETEGVAGRKREISLATSRDLGLVRPSPSAIALKLISNLIRERSSLRGSRPTRRHR